jgi:cytochrome c5
LLRRLAAPSSATYSAEQVGELFELASLLTTRDRALGTKERAQKTARIALQVLAGTTGQQQGTALAAIGALAAVWPAAQKALYSGGAVTQLQALLADEVAPRRRGQALFALGALFPEHERTGRAPAAIAAAQAPDRALLRAGLADANRFVRRQAILGATLARDEALDAPLLGALRQQLSPASPTATAVDGPADPATLHIPATLTPAEAVELLPLLPAFVDLLLSLPAPATAVALDKALQLTQVVAAASPRSGTAQFLLAQVQSRRRDPAAVGTLRKALALGNLPGVFVEALGADGRKLASTPDVPAARRQVRAALALRPRSRPRADLAKVVTAAELGSGQTRVAVVSPTELERRAAAVLAGPGVDSAAARTLGAELFASYPFGSEADYDSCLRSFLFGNNHDLIESLGLNAEHAPTGGQRLVGIVEAKAADATASRYGVTCALCHAQVDAQGHRQDGLPSRTYDQGLLLAACVEQPIHYKSGNRNLDDLLDYRPGRNDSSSDGVHNPAEIPSLFGLRVGGAVRWNGDTPTLAVQIDRNLSARSAPPAVITLVAAYLRALPLSPAPSLAPRTARLVAAGSAVFAQNCQRCHAPPAYTTGEIIPQPEILTDAMRVSAVLPNSSEGYKIPSLLRVSRSAPYLHDGSVPTLEALLDRSRSPATGHPHGRELKPSERLALLAFLRSL